MARTLEVRRHADDDGDDALTDAGVRAARALGRDELAGGYALVATSGAQRATQTAACLLAGLGQDVPAGVVVVRGFRSEHEDAWRDAYAEAGSGHLADLRDVAPDLVAEDGRVLGDALRAVLGRLEDGARALVIGHSPTSEAAVLDLTGVVVEPLRTLEGVEVVVDDDGSTAVTRLGADAGSGGAAAVGRGAPDEPSGDAVDDDYLVAPEQYVGDGFVLRSWQPGDGERLTAAVEPSHEHLSPWLAWARPEQPVEVSERLVREFRGAWLRAEDFVVSVHDPTGARALGGTGFHLRGAGLGAREAEIGMWVRVEEAGRGLGTRLLVAMLSWGFTAWPWLRLEWRCDRDNHASRRTAEKAGMVLEGTLRNQQAEVGGGRRDTLVFAAQRDEWHAPDAP